jgi:DNA polymerase-1
MPDRPVLYLIDGYAQFFRAYHAIRSGLSSPVTGEATNLTFGFIGLLLKILRERKPDYLAVVLDVSGDRGTFRSELYPEYKAHREPPPSDFGPQVDRCLSMLPLFGIPQYGCEGMEADDVLATVVRKLRKERPDLDIRLVSKDKDLGQLLDERVSLYDAHRDETLGVEQLFERKGVRPEQVIDMLALMGDTSDNVPGVAGIGPKTAAELVTTYGSLEGVLANLDRLTPKRREAIENAREILPLARRLVTLRDDCPVDFDLEASRVDPARIRGDELLAMFRTLGFENRLPGELRAILGKPAAEAAPAVATPPKPARAARPKPEESGGLFDQVGAESSSATAAAFPPIPALGEYAAITTLEGLDVAIAACRTAGRFAFDIENDATDSGDSEDDGGPKAARRLCGISLAVRPGHAWYLPLVSPEASTHRSLAECLERLRSLFGDGSLAAIAHHAKFDVNALLASGIEVRNRLDDSMIAAWLVDSARSSYGLKGLAEGLLGLVQPTYREVVADRGRRSFAEVPLADAVPYAAADADVALRLFLQLEPQLKSAGLERLYREVEMPLVAVLAGMERAGIGVDGAELDRQRERLDGRIAALRTEIASLAPRPFNPDSPKQLAEVLFHRPLDPLPGLGLKPVKKTKTGFSTDVEVLEKLASDPSVESELPARIVEYRQLTKLVGTYLVALKEAISPQGRIHASFHQTGTATGRLSSSDPNLQNIPIRTATGREIRKAFVAGPGCLFLCADYSQIELRMLAHLSGDPGLSEAFRRGEDIHRAVAAEVYGVAIDQVTDEMRSAAKMVNFGIVYGITAFGLARRLGGGTSRERAQAIIDGYRARFVRIAEFLARCVAEAKEKGFVTTVLGRRRPVPQVHSRNPAERALGERIAINTVVQGSAADLIKIAMVRLDARLRAERPRSRLLLQIHDELLVECPEAEVREVEGLVVATMEGAMDLSVPLKVEAGSGRDWFAC